MGEWSQFCQEESLVRIWLNIGIHRNYDFCGSQCEIKHALQKTEGGMGRGDGK